MKLQKLSDAKVGDELIFTYDSGSIPGAVRHVKVTEIKSKAYPGVSVGIVGNDLKDGGKIKRFSDKFASNITCKSIYIFGIGKDGTIDDPSLYRYKVRAINFITAREQVMQSMTADQLAEFYKTFVIPKEDVVCRYNSNTGCLEIFAKEVEESLTVAPNETGSIFMSVVTRKGETVKIGLDGIGPRELQKKISEALDK